MSTARTAGGKPPSIHTYGWVGGWVGGWVSLTFLFPLLEVHQHSADSRRKTSILRHLDSSLKDPTPQAVVNHLPPLVFFIGRKSTGGLAGRAV